MDRSVVFQAANEECDRWQHELYRPKTWSSVPCGSSVPPWPSWPYGLRRNHRQPSKNTPRPIQPKHFCRIFAHRAWLQYYCMYGRIRTSDRKLKLCLLKAAERRDPTDIIAFVTNDGLILLCGLNVVVQTPECVWNDCMWSWYSTMT